MHGLFRAENLGAVAVGGLCLSVPEENRRNSSRCWCKQRFLKQSANPPTCEDHKLMENESAGNFQFTACTHASLHAGVHHPKIRVLGNVKGCN